MEPIQDHLTAAINQSLKKLGLKKEELPEVILDFPTDPRFGELSTNIALKLAKIIKKSPVEVAKEIISGIKSSLKKHKLDKFIEDIRVEGAGFINFYLHNDFFLEYLKLILTKGYPALKVNYGKGRKVLIEFVSANPTGALSVAHARQAAVGDCLSNVLEFSGFKVKREYYLNDEGNQINILGRSIELRLKELNGENIEFPEDYYQGDYITDIARIIKDKHLEIKDFSEFGKDHILGIIKQELADFGVKFDYWYSQRSLRESGKIEKAFLVLREKGYLYEQDGAVWFKSTVFGDDKDRVVVKSDRSFTYLAPDIAYHRDKYRRGFELLINLWGPDHHGYINRLKASCAAFGKDPASLSIIIVQLATIFRGGKPVQMSTRRGEFITLREVLDEVGSDAARFFFLMRRTSSHLDFDLEIAKKQTSENPVYYVQYAHARICSILRSAGKRAKIKSSSLLLLKEAEEISLLKKLWQFSYILNVCVLTQDPFMLTVYLQELAEHFHKFYDLHRVLSDDDALTEARLGLINGARIVLSTGLKLLGVSSPEKM
ncbi:MAG: arginine--tRNA ligase [Candidatus Omnitrophica bacterium]|nr:arginine--tRNA ligase [Candidatus Omnitrophota bacterium]